jgi:hypothetical protein
MARKVQCILNQMKQLVVLNSFDVSCSSAVSVNMCSLRAGEFQCPVLNKVFTEFTHIVAVKTTGNVFCYEVGFRLCLAS